MGETPTLRMAWVPWLRFLQPRVTTVWLQTVTTAKIKYLLSKPSYTIGHCGLGLGFSMGIGCLGIGFREIFIEAWGGFYFRIGCRA